MKKLIEHIAVSAAIGAITGCGGMAQHDREVSTSVWAIGIPGVAILHDAHVMPDNKGDSVSEATQTNMLHVDSKLK